MTSVLFQSTDKGGSSSSASANPFLALTHFYEQELTDPHIDTHLHGYQVHPHTSYGKQPVKNGYHHLFPSSTAMSLSSSSSSLSSNSTASMEFGTGKGYTQGDSVHHYSYTSSPQDEFKSFSSGHRSTSGSSSSKSSLPLCQDDHPTGKAGADLSEYLKQRQEYYAREAFLRSQDRHDGLGPIMDFSELHQHERHHVPSQWGSDLHQLPHQRMQASSQQEQVLIDLGHSAVEEFNSTDHDQSRMDHVWKEALTTTSHPTASGDISAPWPMARWAIETEAALMEFESLNPCYSTSLHRPMSIHGSDTFQGHEEQRMHGTLSTPNNWSEEFSASVSTMAPPVLNSGRQGGDSDIATRERRKSLKTCGFMLDPKTSLEGRDLTDPSTLLSFTAPIVDLSSRQRPGRMYNDDVFEGDMLQAWMESLALEKQEAELHFRVSDQARQDSSLEDNRLSSSERAGKVYNDDEFEGDMLQAWMETLAQEKQEANERAREEEARQEKEETIVDEEEQRVAIEVALRRLNALMYQLNRHQGAEKPFKATRVGQSS
ncbi:hypothetical protein BGX34_002505 [Mortierella sp. NVP85]|nr:hypothetical protein BGX34_002505 [Mortierella sp. NVP85]